MEKKQNFSKKREAILNLIKSTKTHPSAEWIYMQLKPIIPDLSLATVYRNLVKFKEDGDIITIATVNGQERIDGNTIPHAHFICVKCGAVIDVDAAFDNRNINEEIENQYNVKTYYHELTFFGECEKCK